jgi:hypothetical protein
LYDSKFSTKKSDFAVTDRVTVVVSMDQQVDYPGASFAVNNAYMCCMKDRKPMPAYDPTNNKYGCAKKTDEMESWIQLFDEGTALTSDFDTTYMPMGFSLFQYGFSFSLLSLSGENDQLCYIHTESTLKDKNNRRSLHSIVDSGDSEFPSWTAFQLMQDDDSTAALKEDRRTMTVGEIVLISLGAVIPCFIAIAICCFCAHLCYCCHRARKRAEVDVNEDERVNKINVIRNSYTVDSNYSGPSDDDENV